MHDPIDPTATDPYTLEMARATATYAHVAYFSSRRGILPSDAHTLALYDNHPYEGDPLRRERVLADVILAMAVDGYAHATRASYPIGGESDGYTVAIVWPGVADQEQARRTLTAIWECQMQADLTAHPFPQSTN